jgi:thioredoxin 1
VIRCPSVPFSASQESFVPETEQNRKPKSLWSGTTTSVVILMGVLVGIGAVFYLKSKPAPKSTLEARTSPQVGNGKTQHDSGKTPLPRLIDLGADKCIPCKLMTPIFDELRREYDGRLEVTVIDVWKNPDAVKQYGIRGIPTQIFYDASGKELFRHVGFLSKQDILAKWKELGIEIERGRKNGENPLYSSDLWNTAWADHRPRPVGRAPTKGGFEHNRIGLSRFGVWGTCIRHA